MSKAQGTVIADRYELGDILGQGAQGTVFRARDKKTGRRVAIKMLTPGVAHNPDLAVRLAREQEALVALAGTSAVAVYDLCRSSSGSLCLVMELLEGSDLEKHLAELERKSERMPKERISAIFEPIIETLERAHDAGIVHRDVKPSNIFLLADGVGVRLLDFGLSRMKAAAPLTAAGMVVGSPVYIAPEIWKGQSEKVDRRADVYSLAVILFRCLSGTVPFERESLVELLHLVTTAPRPSLHALRPDLPKAIDTWVEKALAVDRAERFDDVRALYAGLLRALEYTPPPRAPRPVAESLIGAWRAATSVFRRFIDAASNGNAQSASGNGSAEAIDDDDGDRPTLEFKRPPPSLPPETAAIDDAWEEVADSEIHSSLPAKRTTAQPAAPQPASDEWDEVTKVEIPQTPKKKTPKPKAKRTTAKPRSKKRAAKPKPARAPARAKSRGTPKKATKAKARGGRKTPAKKGRRFS